MPLAQARLGREKAAAVATMPGCPPRSCMELLALKRPDFGGITLEEWDSFMAATMEPKVRTACWSAVAFETFQSVL